MSSRVAVQVVSPPSASEVAAVLGAGEPVRVRGGGTKLGWGFAVEAAIELRTDRFDAVVAHNEGDLTAVLQAGVPLARAQEVFAAAGQMLALDPPLGVGSRATIGGVIATGDSGPLRHRYGAPRDLVLGVQVALPDGTVARAGSQVIKNVAGYDLAKLMSGAFGTLGVLTEVTVRLHPRPSVWWTAIGRGDDPHTLAAATSRLTHLPLEAEALDLRWEDGAGAVLARFGGASAGDRVDAALAALRAAGLEAEAVGDDEALWAAQREGQRAASGGRSAGDALDGGPAGDHGDGGAVSGVPAGAGGATGSGVAVRVSTTQDRFPALIAAAKNHDARVVARAAHGLAWVTLPAAEPHLLVAAVEALRDDLGPAACVVLDAPETVRASTDPWGPVDAAQVALMRRVKERFDPNGVCNPGLFVGGI